MTINYIELEEKLIKNQMTLRDTIKEKEVLEKIDSILDKYDKRSSEKLSIKGIKTAEHLSKEGKLKLPLKVKGVMLGVGRHKKRYYSEEELKKSILKYKSKKFPIKLDHRNLEASSTIGGVDRIYWMPEKQAIGFEGHINDETHARNLMDKLHTDVSATIIAFKDYNEQNGVVASDLEYDELSIVYEGAYQGNSIKVA